MGTPRRVLAITGGHRVDLDAWLALLDAVCVERGWVFAHAVQPAAQRWLTAEHCGAFDALLLHDIPGLHLRRGEPPRAIDPSPAIRDGLAAWTDAGVGIVVTHHSLAAWPSWDGWAHAVGGRFHYAPGRLDGADEPSSGTVIDSYRVTITAPDHPVCAGLEPFDLTDERYLCPVFADEVVPLLSAAEATVSGDHFVSTFEHVVVGEAAAPRCSATRLASRTVAWATSVGASPVTYIQPGDTPTTFAVPAYRRLVGNALEWSMSADARQWALGRARPLDLTISEEH